MKNNIDAKQSNSSDEEFVKTNVDKDQQANLKYQSKKRATWRKILFYFVLIMLALSLAFSIILVITGGIDESEKTRAQYTFNIIQCVLGIVMMFVPSILNKHFKIVLPNAIEIIYFVFLFCAIYLGEIRGFYRLIPIWDSILHIFSGFMLGALGFYAVELLNEIKVIDLNPLFVAAFAFCFSITLGAIWEIYEFLVDLLFATNSQRYADLITGADKIGQDALADTMKDIIIDACGALAVAIAGGINLKIARRKASALANKNTDVNETLRKQVPAADETASNIKDDQNIGTAD